MTKVMDNIQDALSFVESGHTVLVGGFGLDRRPSFINRWLDGNGRKGSYYCQ